MWQQQDWRRLGTHFSRHRKCSSDISTTSYTLLLLPAAAVVIPVEAQPRSSPAPKGDVLYGLHTTLVSQQSNRKMKRSPKRKTDLASGRKQMNSARFGGDASRCWSCPSAGGRCCPEPGLWDPAGSRGLCLCCAAPATACQQQTIQTAFNI